MPVVSAAAPWPGEPWPQSQNLTGLDDGFGKDLSGSHWNSETRTLWVCDNGSGTFVAVVEDGSGGFKVDQRNGQRGEWSPGGDLEGITQVDFKEQSVYVMAEGEDVIRKYDTSVYGTVRLLNSWNIKAFVPTSGGAGSEGIAFVPDAWLTVTGFVDATGAPYVSKNGMQGLMFVAHQNGGSVYVFDLNPASTAVTFVGAYKTSKSESSGLEFDRSSGKLYVWHNTGVNYLEEVDLASVPVTGGRQFKTLREWDGPKTGNLESVALTPVSAREHWAFLTDDDNQGGFALMHFRQFAPDLKSLNIRVAASTDDAEESVIGSANVVSTDLELIRDASDQTVGMRFNAVSIPVGARVTAAYIQFGTDETSSETTNLVIRAQAIANSPPFEAKFKNLSARTKTTATTAVTWAPAPWAVLGEAGAGQRTPDLRAVLQEVISTPGWQAGNSVVFLLTGKGKRVAEAYDGDRNLAPLLHIEYEP